MTLLFFAKFLSWYGDSGSARNSSMPRETFTAPATLPLSCTSGESRTSTTSVLPLAIISRACAGVTRGTAALAASIICLTFVAMASSSFNSSLPAHFPIKSNPRNRPHLGRKKILHRHPPMGDALIVGVTAKCLNGRPALLDAVRIRVGPEASRDLLGNRRRPGQRNARAGEVAQPVQAAALGLVEHLEEIHRDPGMLF